MNDVTFTPDAWEEYVYWQSEDKKTLRKINGLIKEIMRDPFGGEGKPEPLRGDKARLWSRRINSKDRLIHFVEDDVVTIVHCKDHYDDK